MTTALSPWKHAALALVLLPGTGAVVAQPAVDPAVRVSPVVSAQTVEQKAAMLDRVLNHSPVAARVAGSGSRVASASTCGLTPGRGIWSGAARCR